jgi:hypothetical protein
VRAQPKTRTQRDGGTQYRASQGECHGVQLCWVNIINWLLPFGVAAPAGALHTTAAPAGVTRSGTEQSGHSVLSFSWYSNADTQTPDSNLLFFVPLQHTACVSCECNADQHTAVSALQSRRTWL